MATHPCPVCRRPVDPTTTPAMPFCSQRCRAVDLGRWLDERYGVPVEREQDEPEEMPPDLEPGPES